MGIFSRPKTKDDQYVSKEEIKHYVSCYNKMKQERNDMKSERDLAVKRMQEALDTASHVQTLESEVVKYKAAYENAQNRAEEIRRELSEAIRANEILTSRLEKSKHALKSALQYQQSLMNRIAELRSRELIDDATVRDFDASKISITDFLNLDMGIVDEGVPPVIAEVKVIDEEKVADIERVNDRVAETEDESSGTETESSGDAQAENNSMTLEDIVEFEKEHGIGETDEETSVSDDKNVVVAETKDESSGKTASEFENDEQGGIIADSEVESHDDIDSIVPLVKNPDKAVSEFVVPENSAYTDTLKSEDEDIPVVQPLEEHKSSTLDEIERLTQALSDIQNEGGIFSRKGTVENNGFDAASNEDAC